MATFTSLLDRLRQNSTARLEAASATLRSAEQATRLGGRQFLAGDLVFDTVSGFDGVVTEATGFAGAGVPSVVVRLSSGDVVGRSAAALILRPARPTSTP